MIKASVLYSNTPGCKFDLAYYRDTHMPAAAKLLGGAISGYQIDSGIGGGAPGQPAPYVCMGHFIAESVPAFMNAFGPHVPALMADLPNFTDTQPTIQFSEIVKG